MQTESREQWWRERATWAMGAVIGVHWPTAPGRTSGVSSSPPRQRAASSRATLVKPANVMSVVVSLYAELNSQYASSSSRTPSPPPAILKGTGSGTAAGAGGAGGGTGAAGAGRLRADCGRRKPLCGLADMLLVRTWDGEVRGQVRRPRWVAQTSKRRKGWTTRSINRWMLVCAAVSVRGGCRS